MKLADRGKLLPFEVLCRIGAVLRSGRGGIGVNRSCRRAFSIRKSPRAPSVLDGFYAFVIRNTGFDQIAVLVKIDVALAGLAVAVKKMPHKASAFFAVYPFALEHLIHFFPAEIPLDTDAVTVLFTVEPIAVVGVFHICFTARGFAVLDELAPAAAFAVLPITLIGVAVCPGVCSVTVAFAIHPVTVKDIAICPDVFSAPVLFSVNEIALEQVAVNFNPLEFSLRLGFVGSILFFIVSVGGCDRGSILEVFSCF